MLHTLIVSIKVINFVSILFIKFDKNQYFQTLIFLGMKIKCLLYPLSMVVILATSCTPKTNVQNNKEIVSETAAFEKFKKQVNDGKNFGDKVTPEGASTYDDILPRLKALKGSEKIENVKMTGTVLAVCKAKGCWMTLQSDKGEPEIFVKFKDYGFFMPKDVVGKKVLMQGYAFKEVTNVETLRHFAEDEGKSKEEIAKITQPKDEYKFLANGVVILN